MSYDQETVIGVFKQCQDMLAENSSVWDDLNYLIGMAKRGEFTPPTLEEVWEEKCQQADNSNLWKFIFEFEGETYMTIKTERAWSEPEMAPKL